MTRPDAAKLGYAVALATLATATWWLVYRLEVDRLWALLALGVLLLLPSRVQAAVLRKHFQGRRAHLERKFDDALALYREQLEALEQRPWKNRSVWLGWMFYTTRADAMVWNNIAALHLDRGEPERARSAARRALELDPKYPLPWINLAGVSYQVDDRAELERCVAQAQRLGYRATTADQLIARAGAAWAKVQAGSELGKPS